jgi:hypothetical protein
MLEKIWVGPLPNYKEKLKHVGEVLYTCLDLLWIIIANYNFALKKITMIGIVTLLPS